MGTKSSIEWTDATWNPVRGCSRVSPGCLNCYAEKIATRFSDPGQPFHLFASRTPKPRWTGKVELVESALNLPLKWRNPKRVFVNSMSDLFHENLSDEAIDRVFAVMALCQQHTFQVLTKRPDRMLAYLCDPSARRRIANAALCHRFHMDVAENIAESPYMWPLPNVWLGCSCENQTTADARIPLLLQIPAAKRFISYEPALGPVDFAGIAVSDGTTRNVLTGEFHDVKLTSADGLKEGLMTVKTAPHIDWVIVGGESGPCARPFDIGWSRKTIRQCKEAGVACFVKQMGAKPIDSGYEHWGHRMRIGDGNHEYNKYIRVPLKDRKGGDWLEWPEDLRVRQFPEVSV